MLNCNFLFEYCWAGSLPSANVATFCISFVCDFLIPKEQIMPSDNFEGHVDSERMPIQIFVLKFMSEGINKYFA